MSEIKTLKNVVDEKQVGIKEITNVISSLNAYRKLSVSEVLEVVKLILLVHNTDSIVGESSRSTLRRVKTYLR